MKNFIKINLELNPFDWHKLNAESVWAEPVSDNSVRAYYIKNTPFYANSVSFLDIVTIQESKDIKGVFFLSDIVEKSGHSTYRILFDPENVGFESYWKKLELLGCGYESSTEGTIQGTKGFYAVDVPKETDIFEVYEVLEDGENNGIWTFDEGHVGHLISS